MKPETSRKKAQRLGRLTYHTGKPCKYGHITDRTTSNGNCIECGNSRSIQRYHKVLKFDPTYVDHQRRLAKDQYIRDGTKWYHENKDKATAQNKAWIARNKEEFKLYCVQWRRDNPIKLCINATAYRAQKIKATPSWINDELVEQFYSQAAAKTKEMGVQYVVDHMVPLNSDMVCGLHWEGNLQVITLKENSSKNCRWWPNQEWETK